MVEQNPQVILPNSCIKNKHISGSLSDIISTDKVQSLIYKDTNFNLAIGATPVAREEIRYLCRGDGDIRGFHALLNETGSSTSVSFDLKKNGVSVLSSVVTITHADADRSRHDGTLSSTTFVADDVLSISMAVSSSTGAQGPYACVILSEDVAPE